MRSAMSSPTTRGMRGRVLVTIDARYAPIGGDAHGVERQITDAPFASPAHARAYAARWSRSPGYTDVTITYREDRSA